MNERPVCAVVHMQQQQFPVYLMAADTRHPAAPMMSQGKPLLQSLCSC